MGRLLSHLTSYYWCTTALQKMPLTCQSQEVEVWGGLEAERPLFCTFMEADWLFNGPRPPTRTPLTLTLFARFKKPVSVYLGIRVL